MAIINKSTNTKCWQGCGRGGTLMHCWWEGRLVQPLWKAVRRYLKKLKLELPYDPAIPLLGIYPKKPETLIQKNISTPMFIAVSFTITKIWKQPKCLSLNEYIKQPRDIYTAVPHKRSFVEKWEVQAPGPLVGNCPEENCQHQAVSYAAKEGCCSL